MTKSGLCHVKRCTHSLPLKDRGPLVIAKPTDTATEIHISRFNALICQDSLQDSFMTAAMSLLPTVCTEEKPKVGTQTEGTHQEVWFAWRKKA